MITKIQIYIWYSNFFSNFWQSWSISIGCHNKCWRGFFNTVILAAIKCKEVRFASAISGGFITAIVVAPPERRLAKRTSVKWSAIKWYFDITGGIYLWNVVWQSSAQLMSWVETQGSSMSLVCFKPFWQKNTQLWCLFVGIFLHILLFIGVLN